MAVSHPPLSSPSRRPALVAGASLGAAESPPSTRSASRSSCTSSCCPEEQALLKELTRRQGPPRVPEDLLGPARSRRRAPRPTSSRTTCAPSGSRPTSSSRTRTRRARRPGCGQVLAAPRPARRRSWQGDVPAYGAQPGHGDGHRARPGRDVRQHGLPARGLDARAGDLGLPRPARPALPFTGRRAARSPSTPSAASPRAASSLEDLHRAAAGARHAARPRPTSRGRDGHLVPLAGRSRRQRGAAPAISSPHPATDFPLAAETKLVMRGPKGEALVAGPRPALARRAGGGARARCRSPSQAADASGQAVVSAAREASWPRRPTARSWRPGACR